MRTPLSGLPVLFSLLAAGCSGPAPVAVNPPPDATPVVSEKPAIDTPGPVIRVTAAYPGASANVVTDTVAIPLEQSINGTEGLVLIESQMNSNGDYLATLHFAPKTDIRVAQVLVQNRVALMQPRLPPLVVREGIATRRGDFARFPRLWVALVSPDGTRDAAFLQNYTWLKLKDELARVPGVADVRIPATPASVVQVWLDPLKLEARKLTFQEVVGVLQMQPLRMVAGKAAPPKDGIPYLTGTVAGPPVHAAHMESIILRASADGEIVRLKDVGKVEVGLGDPGIALWNGQPVALIAITPAAGLDIEALRKSLPGPEKLPKGMKVELAADLAAESFEVVELRLPIAASPRQTRKATELAVELIRSLPVAPEIFAFAEREPNRATLLVKLPAKAIPEIRNSLKDVKNLKVRVSDLSSGRPFPVRLALCDGGESGPEKLREWAVAVAKKLSADGIAIDPAVEPGREVPQVYVDIDGEKVKMLGVSMDSVLTTLQAFAGTAAVVTVNKFARTTTVRIEPGAQRIAIDDLKKLHIRNEKGAMLPLRSFVAIRTVSAPPAVLRVNLYPALYITAAAPAGKTVAEVTTKCVEIAEGERKALKMPEEFKVIHLVNSKPR